MSKELPKDELSKRIEDLEDKLKERAKRNFEKDKTLSSTQYSYLVELSIESVLQCTSEGKIVAVNSKFSHLCGYSVDDLIGMDICTIFKNSNYVESLSITFLQSDTKDVLIAKKNGSVANVEVMIQHLPNDVFQIIVKDVTEHLENKESVFELEETLRLIFENSYDGIIYYQEFEGGVMKLVDCNNFFLEDAGFTKEQLISCENFQTLMKIISPPDAKGRFIFSWLRPDGKENIIEHTPIHIKRRKINFTIGFNRNITAKTQAENAFRLDELRLEALLKLNQMETKSLPEIIDFVLNEGVALTQSKIGYIAFVGEDEKMFNVYSWSKDVLSNCTIDNKQSIFNVEDTGLWGEVIRQRKAIITNNYLDSNILRKGIPEGHVPLHKHMNVPVFDDNKIVVVAGVANKENDYNEADIRQLTLLMVGLWNNLKKRKMEIDIRQSKERLQSLYDLIQNDFETEKDLVEYALEQAILLTGSKIGFFYYNDEKSTNSNLFISQENDNVFKNRQLDQSFIEETGVVSKCLSSLKPFVSNSTENENSYSIVRQIAVPVIDKNKKVVLVSGVANKNENYDENDVRQLERYIQEVWKIILRMRSDIALKENEIILKQQNEEFIAINEELNESNIKVMTIVDELKQAKEKAEESDRLKTSFLANMSHEIRTPMNAITGFAELLRQPGIDTTSINQYVEIIFSNSQQLLSLIDDIIDISRIEAEKVSINKDVVNVNKVVTEIAVVFEKQASDKGLNFETKTALDDDKAFIVTDQARLKQILNNLLSNAVKFTNEGSISMGYNIYSSYIEFYVSDTGIGIAKENYEVIFERFRQVETGLSRLFGGTGLGLTISKFLVSLLGGKIWLSSQLGIGSTFYFTIPLVTAENTCETESQDILAVHYSWEGKKFLVAEDEEFNYYYIHEILTPTNATLLHAKTGREAVELCRKNPDIDIILMDIKMPELDGYEATKIIKSFRPKLPIIAQTAHAMSEDMAKSIKAGCDGYITKPIHKEHLLKIIQEKIGKKKLVD
jgi:PAS domain S-box-containing protein